MPHALKGKRKRRLYKASHVLLMPSYTIKGAIYPACNRKCWRTSLLSQLLRKRLLKKSSRVVREAMLSPLGLLDADVGMTGPVRFPHRIKFYVVGHGEPSSQVIQTDCTSPECFSPYQLANLFEKSLSRDQSATIALQNCYSGKGTHSFALNFAAQMKVRGYDRLTIYAYPQVILYQSDGPTLIATDPAHIDGAAAASINITMPGEPALAWIRARDGRVVLHTRDLEIG